jgi:hypothetical protein
MLEAPGAWFCAFAMAIEPSTNTAAAKVKVNFRIRPLPLVCKTTNEKKHRKRHYMALLNKGEHKVSCFQGLEIIEMDTLLLTAMLLAQVQRTQSSSASRLTAGAFGFLTLIQSSDRPARDFEPSRLETIPSQPSLQVW